jgi:hypothetical protein
MLSLQAVSVVVMTILKMELSGEERGRAKIAILLGIDIDEFDINNEYNSNAVANSDHYRFTSSRLKSCKCVNCFHKLRVDITIY